MPPITDFDLGELDGIAQRGERAILEDRAKIEFGCGLVRPRQMQRLRASRAHGRNGAGLVGDVHPFNSCHICMSKA
jgi:hypothetical protein